jgi:WD40 repeat protein
MLAAKIVTLLGERVVYAQFCRFNDPDNDPLRLVEGIASALANRYPAALDALAADPSVSVVVSGSATAESVAEGAVLAGVRVGALHIHAMAPRLAFDRTVRRAVQAIRSAGQADQIVVLVDALDEAGAEPDTVAGLLRDVLDPQARAPENLRWILTSRPDPRLLGGLDLPLLDLDDEPAGSSDIALYASSHLAGIPAEHRQSLAADVAEASGGNFLYARYVLRELRSGGSDPIRLPDGLDEIYGAFLGRELRRSPERWSERYQPLLGLLVVARGDGLTNELLAHASRLPQSQVDNALQVCAQYLAGPVPEGPVRLYHQSLRDFLLAPGPVQVYSKEAQNSLIAALLESPYQEYALANLTEHLLTAGRAADLEVLLGDLGFLAERAARFGVDAVLSDLRDSGAVDLLAVVERAAHLLRGRETPELFVRQAFTAARELDLGRVADRARSWLIDRGLPFLEPLWRTGTPPPAVRHVITPPGERVITHRIAVSADWHRVAAAGLGSGIGLWHFDTAVLEWQRERQTLTHALALSHDGALLAESEEREQDQVITVWNTVEDRLVWRTPDLMQEVNRLTFSANGELLLGAVGRGVWVWTVSDGTLIHSHDYEFAPSLATFRDGRLLVNSDRGFHTYDAVTGEVLGSVQVSQESSGATLVAADPAGQWVACAWGNCMIDLVQMKSGRNWHFTLPYRAEAIAIGPRDGVTVVTTGDQFYVVQPDRKPRNGNLPNNARCWHLVVAGDGSHALADANDGALYEIDLGSLNVTRRLTGLFGVQHQLADPDSGRMIRQLAGGPGVQLVTYERTAPTPRESESARSAQVSALAVSPSGERALVGLKQRPTELWDLGDGALLSRIHAREPMAVAVDEASGIALTSSGAECWVWALDTGLDQHFRYTRPPLALTHDGMAVSVDYDGTIVAWQPTWRGDVVRRYTGNTGPVIALGVTADGTGVTSVGSDGQVLTWDTEGEPAHSLRLATKPTVAAVNPDLGLVATWPDCRVLEVPTGHVRPAFGGPAGAYFGVHLAFIGPVLVIALGHRKELECWDVNSGRRLLTRPLDSSVQALDVTSEGCIFAADLDRNLHLWRLSIPPTQIAARPL